MMMGALLATKSEETQLMPSGQEIVSSSVSQQAA
jgi:hypothetical protein